MGAAVLALSAAGLFGAATAGAQSDSPRSCGWNVPISHDQVDLAWPDEGARYWTDLMAIPPGGHIELAGQFPHARYLSFNTYSARVVSTDALTDVEIQPDPGSTNPFLPGADRRATKRGYRIRIVGRPAPTPPAEREPNTLYAGSVNGTDATPGPLAGFAIRVYEPDRGLDDTGGVGLPRETLVEADGTRHQVPECPYLHLPYAGQHQLLAGALPSPPLPPTGALGRATPRWHKFTNSSSLVTNTAADNDVTGDAVAAPLTGQFDQTLPGGGIGENRDNKYLYTTFAADQGQVLVLRGKAPTAPETYDGQRKMGTGEVRYWSVCAYAETSNSYGCVHDDQVPLDRHGRYTIAVSSAASRPKGATTGCGMAWVPAPAPRAVLFVRHLLADPAFAHAIQRTQPGTEQQTMGDYYPSPGYESAAAFDKELSCG